MYGSLVLPSGLIRLGLWRFSGRFSGEGVCSEPQEGEEDFYIWHILVVLGV